MANHTDISQYVKLDINADLHDERVSHVINTKTISSSQLIVLVSVFLISFGNMAFFRNVLDVYPANASNLLFILSLSVVFTCVTIIAISLLCYRYTLKPVLIAVLLLSSLAAYFMDTYQIIIDHVMIDNIFSTDVGELTDLAGVKQFIYLLCLGIVPAILVYKTELACVSFKQEIISRFRLIAISLALIISCVFIFGNYYASFIREHKPLRYYANPAYYMYSTGKYLSKFNTSVSGTLKPVGLDATIAIPGEQRKLFVFVVGETARADHFSLNGYQKQTNYYLEQEKNLINFTNVWSCGTSTSVSVPCMFSMLDRSNYSKSKASKTENVLDVLQHAGVNVLWLDNNSDSKGVASRVPYESYKTDQRNPVCDIECRDVGMLENLQSYINARPDGDIFIVLHQMGNHGPAYYKRYPAEFEKFTPTCQANRLEKCSKEEINNAYDNAILYTDYFLSRTISVLKENNDQFDTGLLYVSDHGESLGENNLYLHGLPYMLAPDAQKHVPMIIWFSDKFAKDNVNIKTLAENRNNEYSHDNIFHTILGLMNVETNVYLSSMDFLKRDG